MKNNDKKSAQLGMPHGTASGRLRKSIIFKLLKESVQNFCFQCGGEIESEKELSIEHKIPYLDSEDPKKLFFDLDNIAFSHLECNIGAARRKPQSHPSVKSYDRGCRCKECTTLATQKVAATRKRRKQRDALKAHVEEAIPVVAKFGIAPDS